MTVLQNKNKYSVFLQFIEWFVLIIVQKALDIKIKRWQMIVKCWKSFGKEKSPWNSWQKKKEICKIKMCSI